MPSASAHAMPLKSPRPVSVWRQLRRFFQRPLQPAGPSIPGLPDDLRGDVALPPSRPESREAAFWDRKRGSGGRDLPL